MRIFPQVLAIFTDPDLSGFQITRETPRIAQPIGPRLRTHPSLPQKWIVLRHPVRLTGLRAINVEAEDFRKQGRRILSGQIGIAVGSAVAAGDVQHAVATEGRGRAVVTIRRPRQNTQSGPLDYPPWSLTRERVANDAGMMLLPGPNAIRPDVKVSVFLETRVKAQTVSDLRGARYFHECFQFPSLWIVYKPFQRAFVFIPGQIL